MPICRTPLIIIDNRLGGDDDNDDSKQSSFCWVICKKPGNRWLVDRKEQHLLIETFGQDPQVVQVGRTHHTAKKQY